MKICVVLDKRVVFSPKEACSIALNTAEFAKASEFRDEITVLGRSVTKAEPFADIHYLPVPGYASKARWHSAITIARMLQGMGVQLVEVQQFEPMAAYLARILARSNIPVVLHKHCFVKRKFYRKLLFYNELAGITFCSDAVRDDFVEYIPKLAAKTVTISNAIDTRKYLPVRDRQKIVLFVGRLAKGKGALPTAKALADVLPEHPEWRAVLVATHRHENPEYAAMFDRALEPVTEQVEVYDKLEFVEIMRLNQQAEIAIVPSLVREGFGRTALEAITGGAALISSGRGGLREVSGKHALYIDEVNASTIAKTVIELINSPQRRASLRRQARMNAEKAYDITTVATKLDTFRRDIIKSTQKAL
jgi:glycosyltransferase involved in cell wall biosynthesis